MSPKDMARIVLLGPPGCGKGTQAERVSDRYKIPQISTGNILRHAIEAKTKLGLEAQSYMSRGELVPDETVESIVAERLSHNDCRKGFILDGFPRDLEQAKSLDKIVSLDVVFNIKVPDKLLIERLSRRRVCDCGETYHLTHKPPKKTGVCDKCEKKLYQRKDDKPATIRHRLQVYHKSTEPLIKYYEKKGALIEIDGRREIGEISQQIIDNLG
ncbi:MAG: adenylate kinase [Candidatus Altiarchaeota archaeon]